jgi:transporter family-2 protein
MLLIVLVFAIGLLQPVQAAMNAEFRRHAGHPLQAGVLNMYVGAATITLVLLAFRLPLPSLSALSLAPRWALCGGLIGATLVTVMLISAPKLGAALLVAVFIAGQITSSVTIDHFGLLGLERRPTDAMRILGLVLLAAGVLLVERSGRG